MLARHSKRGYVPNVQVSIEPRLESRAKSFERAREENRHGGFERKVRLHLASNSSLMIIIGQDTHYCEAMLSISAE